MKIKNMKKKVVPVLVGSAITVAAAVPVLASESGMSGVETALTSSFTQVGTSMTGIISSVLPIALPIMGAVMIIRFGIKIFKNVTNKA